MLVFSTSIMQICQITTVGQLLLVPKMKYHVCFLIAKKMVIF